MSARPLSRGVAVALAAGALALSPVAAHADDTPTATATTPAPVTTTVPAPTTTSSTTDPSSSTTTSADPSATTTSSSTSTSSAPTTAAKVAKAAALSFATPNLADNLVAAASPAADFIATTLAANNDHYDFPPFNPGDPLFLDGGNTADAALGLDAATEGLDEADAATGYLEDHVGDYIGTAGTLYAGNVAKVLILADAQGADPTSFGGVNLVASLQSLETVSGRFSDKPDDFSNSIGQSLAIIALGRVGAPVSDASVNFLLAQQCVDGGFRTFIGEDPCTSDIDTTGFAVQALIGAKGVDDPAVVKALAWLAGKQGANGGFGTSAGLSSNSTALAAQAFAAAGDSARLAKAQAFLTTLQYDCSFPTALRGGIAKSPADFAARAASGSTATVDATDLRATPQSTMALAGESLLTVVAGDGFGDTVPMECATSTSTTTSSTTSHAGASGTSSTPSASTPTGSLAFTGSEVWPLAFIALAFILAGAGALVGSRRRGGAHA